MQAQIILVFPRKSQGTTLSEKRTGGRGRNCMREERQRANFKRSAHCGHQTSSTVAQLKHCSITLHSSRKKYAKTYSEGQPWEQIQNLDEADFMRPIWKSCLCCAEHQASISVFKNHTFKKKKKIQFHNDANDCTSISEPYVSLEEHWHLLRNAISFPIPTLWMQPRGTCSQPGGESTCVCLSALEAKSSRRIPSMILYTFAKGQTRRLCP